jgi:hypothetical protein
MGKHIPQLISPYVTTSETPTRFLTLTDKKMALFVYLFTGWSTTALPDFKRKVRSWKRQVLVRVQHRHPRSRVPVHPRRHGLRISPQAFLRFQRFLLQPLKLSIPWRILPIPPAPAVFDKCVIDVGAIQQEHVSKGTPILVLAVSLEDEIPPEHQR